jgi:hypothetical protein
MEQWARGNRRLIIFAAGAFILSFVAVWSFTAPDSFGHSEQVIPGRIWPGIG